MKSSASAPLRVIPTSLFIFFLFSCTTTAVAARPGIAFPGDNYAEGWVKSERLLRFERNNLFDYIDGGAELFLEFGFNELLVQRYKLQEGEGDNEIGLEVYQMESSEAAMGIYLNKCGKETPMRGIKARNSGDRYQISVLKGSCFLQVNNFGGEEGFLPAMVKLTQGILATIPKGHNVTLLNHLPTENFVEGSGLIIRGPYALQPIFTFGSGDVLQLGGKVFGVVGDYVGTDGDVYTRILILYSEPKIASMAFANLADNLDPYLTILDRRQKAFTFEDYREKFGIVELRDRTIEIKINLSERPAED